MEPHKEWKIKFNQKVDSQTVHEASILVKDINLNPVPINVWLDIEGQTVHASPRVNYNIGDKRGWDKRGRSLFDSLGLTNKEAPAKVWGHTSG